MNNTDELHRLAKQIAELHLAIDKIKN